MPSVHDRLARAERTLAIRARPDAAYPAAAAPVTPGQ